MGVDEWMLHGETRPFDVSSSQSNQRVFLRGGALFGLQPIAQVLRWKRQSQSLARDLRICLKSLPAMPALVSIERKTILSHGSDRQVLAEECHSSNAHSQRKQAGPRSSRCLGSKLAFLYDPWRH